MRHAPLAIGFSFLFALGLAAEAAAATLERGPYSVDKLDIQTFSGSLTIEVGTSSETSLTLEGPEEALEAIDISESDDRLIVQGPARSSSTSVTVVGDTTVVVTGSGHTEVIIGSASTDGAPEETVSLRLAAPAGTALAVSRFVGTATIGDLDAPVQFELLGGTVDAGRVGSAQVDVRGSGDIRLAQVRGDLGMTIQGSGSIVVEDGTVQDLVGEIQGSGTLRFGGRANTARLGINGAGTVDVAHVEREPQTRINGAGTIRVGNWR